MRWQQLVEIWIASGITFPFLPPFFKNSFVYNFIHLYLILFIYFMLDMHMRMDVPGIVTRVRMQHNLDSLNV